MSLAVNQLRKAGLTLLALVVLCFSNASWAVVETYDFENEALRDRYQNFIHELRCPKCQNQNLAGSQSMQASDLRREIHRLLHERRSDEQITAFMVQRYGEFILYRPRFNQETALLWLAPALFLLLGAGVVVAVFKRQKKTGLSDKHADSLSGDEAEQLQQLLDRDQSSNQHSNSNPDAKRDASHD